MHINKSLPASLYFCFFSNGLLQEASVVEVDERRLEERREAQCQGVQPRDKKALEGRVRRLERPQQPHRDHGHEHGDDLRRERPVDPPDPHHQQEHPQAQRGIHRHRPINSSHPI